jgi:signal transduction histidine kinase
MNDLTMTPAVALLSAALDAIPDPILVLDAQKILIVANTAAHQLFGDRLHAGYGQPIANVILAVELRGVIEGKAPLKEWAVDENRVYAPRLVADESGNGWTLILEDISRFKRLSKNQSEFLRIISHDLRSPLTSMKGFGNMLEMETVGPLNDRQKHFLGKIMSGISQMTGLVENIQDAGRYDPEAGFYEMMRSHCDLGEVARHTVETHLLPADKPLSVSVRVDDNIPIVNVDSHMIGRAMLNLYDNAVKYTPGGGVIEVGAVNGGQAIILYVKDSGDGIPLEDQSRLFEKHVRLAREAHKKIKGSGLGLFIVKSVAQRHGGKAWVESAPGMGATFFISIPLEGENLITPEASPAG